MRMKLIFFYAIREISDAKDKCGRRRSLFSLSLSLYKYTARRLKLIFETCSYPTTAVVKLHFVTLKVGY